MNGEEMDQAAASKVDQHDRTDSHANALEIWFHLDAGVKVDTKCPARLHAGQYGHGDEFIRRRHGPSLHRSGALEPGQGMS